MIGVIFVAAALFMQAQPAAADAAASGTVVTPAVVNGKTKAAASDADLDKVVCHSEPVLGTMFPKKTCATKRELAARAVDDQQRTRDATALRPFRDPSSSH